MWGDAAKSKTFFYPHVLLISSPKLWSNRISARQVCFPLVQENKSENKTSDDVPNAAGDVVEGQTDKTQAPEEVVAHGGAHIGMLGLRERSAFCAQLSAVCFNFLWTATVAMRTTSFEHWSIEIKSLFFERIRMPIKAEQSWLWTVLEIVFCN